MPEELDVEQLVSRQESSSSLVRFEDETDANAPRLNYAVPLPGSFSGKLYIETDFKNDQLPWNDAAFEDKRKSVAINEFVLRLAEDETSPLPSIEKIVSTPVADEPRRREVPVRFVERDFETEASPDHGGSCGNRRVERLTAITSIPKLSDRRQPSTTARLALQLDDLLVDLDQLAAEARVGRAPVLYRTFGGAPKLAFVQEADGPEDANPRFVIVEHYRLSSHFGDYGAGKTVGVFSLMPGEETTLYIRNWRRSEATIKQASSIFDSYTEEAASEFETDLLAETTNTESSSSNRKLHSHYSGSGEINLGGDLFNNKHSGGSSDDLELQRARESVSKNVAKVTTNHASKASSKRQTEVTQELQQSEAQEFETITERKVKNSNLSRTLNIVTRELNQEFTTYLALVDVSLAFVNDLGVFETFHIHEIDRMLSKYLPEPPDDPQEITVAPGPFGSLSPYTFVRRSLIKQINAVYDFQGTRHEFLEEVALSGDEEQTFPVASALPGMPTYLRVRRPRRADEPNPFYEPGLVPVEGIVMDENKNTVRTPAVIIDSLLGHGVALDNYALGLQQETLREKQLENRKTETALALIEAGDQAGLDGFRQIFGPVNADSPASGGVGTE